MRTPELRHKENGVGCDAPGEELLRYGEQYVQRLRIRNKEAEENLAHSRKKRKRLQVQPNTHWELRKYYSEVREVGKTQAT